MNQESCTSSLRAIHTGPGPIYQGNLHYIHAHKTNITQGETYGVYTSNYWLFLNTASRYMIYDHYTLGYSLIAPKVRMYRSVMTSLKWREGIDKYNLMSHHTLHCIINFRRKCPFHPGRRMSFKEVLLNTCKP